MAAPGVDGGGLSHYIEMAVKQHRMLAGDKVMPFPGLAAEEGDTAYDGPDQPFGHRFFVSIVPGMNGQHHGHGADDEDEGHNAHEGQGQVHMPCSGESVKDHVGV